MWNDIIFDLYGTLVDIHTDENQPELWEYMAKLYREYGAKYTPDELRATYHAFVREEEGEIIRLRDDAHEARPEIQIEKVFCRLFETKGFHADYDLSVSVGERFRKASLCYIKLYDGAKELLAALRADGKRVWLLSNAQAIFTRYELKLLGLTEFFDGIYLSSDYCCKKPDSKFFRTLLDERSIDPKNAIMVGNDGVCDIAGAKAMGLSTLYIHSNISPKEDFPDADFCLPEMNLPMVQEILLSGVNR